MKEHPLIFAATACALLDKHHKATSSLPNYEEIQRVELEMIANCAAMLYYLASKRHEDSSTFHARVYKIIEEASKAAAESPPQSVP